MSQKDKSNMFSSGKEQIIQMLRSNEKDHSFNHQSNQYNNQYKKSQDQQFQIPQYTQNDQLNNQKLLVLNVKQTINNINYNNQTKQDFNYLFEQSLLFHRKNTNQTYQMPSNYIDVIINLKNFRQNKIYNLILGDTHSYLEDFINLKAIPSLQYQSSNKHEKTYQQPNYNKINVQIATMCAQKRIKNIQKQILKGSFPQIFYLKKNLLQSKQKLQKNISQLRKSLTKVTHILPDRQILAYESADQRKRKKDDSFFQYLSFRKKGYWENNDKSTQISQFLKKINQERSLTHNKYQKSLQRKQKQQKLYFQKLSKQKQIQIRKSVDLNMKKHRQYKQRYMENENFSKQKQKQIEGFLSRYKSDKPLYEKFQQNFQIFLNRQKELQRKRLSQIHEYRRVISLQQFNQHRKIATQRLNQKKQVTKQDLQKIKQEQKVIKQKLKSLYHSKHHNKIKQDQNYVPIDQNLIRKERKQKSLSYSVQVVAKNHKPTIDPFKKMEIEKILQQMNQANKNNPKTVVFKRKKKISKSGDNSQIQNKNNQSESKQKGKQDKQQKNLIQKNPKQNQFKQKSTQTNNKPQQNKNNNQDKKPIQKKFQIQEQEVQMQADPKKIGIQYLKEIRLMNEGKPRKKKQQPIDKSKQGKSIFDYSKQKKDHFKIKITLSQWKKVLQSKQKVNKSSVYSQRYSQIQSNITNQTQQNINQTSQNEFLKRQRPQQKSLAVKKLSMKQKAELLDPYTKRIQIESTMFQNQKRNMPKNNINKVLALNKKIQKCYIQGIKSKLQILKQ